MPTPPSADEADSTTSRPDRFWWGVTSSSVQAEGVAPAADWSIWERDGLAPRSGEGAGTGLDFRDDFRLLASLGLTHVRLTLEWARIEPQAERVDSTAVDHYLDMLRAARDAGLGVVATLHSTSLPGWFADDEGGYGDAAARSRFWERHVDRCAETFESLVDCWVPIDDPIGWALRALLFGSRPPGRRDRADAMAAAEAALEASYDAWRLLSSGSAPTMFVVGVPTVFAVGPESGPHARDLDHLLWSSWIGALRDGELHLPDRAPRQVPEMAHAFELVGLAFDHPVGVDRTGALVAYPTDEPPADNGFVPWPEELGVALHRLAAEELDRPLVVASNGVSTTDERRRDHLLGAAVDQISIALDDGIDVRGYFHDTGVDGYEWRAGFETRRGIIDRDRNLKPAAHTFRDVIAATPDRNGQGSEA